jgi:tRNA threonylcarbamoyladenosine biosynthesis protein TsaB
VILGLDTATAATTAALWDPDGTAVERRDDPPEGRRPAHAERLLVLVEEVLAEAGAGWDEVGRIAVGVGPGGFTGLRLGIATARALAQARGLPLVGVSSLEALAAGAAGAERVVAVIDARRGEVFALLPGAEPAALAPAALAAQLGPGTLAVGDGAVRFREELERAGAAVPAGDSPLHRVSALQVCRLGADGEPSDRDSLLPDYRREPDAQPPRLPK